MQRNSWILLCMLLLILPIWFALTLSYSTDSSISPANATTSDDLNCTWVMHGDGTLRANVTWYVDGAVNQTDLNINCTNASLCFVTSLIPSSYTRKHQTWNCTVKGFNGTQVNNTSTTINISNSDPVIVNIPDVVIPEDSWYIFNVDASDADGDSYTFSDDTSFFNINPSTGVIQWMPNITQIGYHTIAIIAIDNDTTDVGVDVEIVRYNVTAVNDAPYWNPLPGSQTVNESSLLNWTVYAYDEESNYPLNFTDDTALINITNISQNAARILFTPSYEDVGNHTLNLTVADNLSASNTTTIQIVVLSINHNPILHNISNQTAKQGVMFYVNFTAWDFDNETMNFTSNSTFFNVTTWLNISNATHNATGVINFTPTNNDVGNHTILITVYDNRSGSDSQLVHFMINNTNDAPNITLPVSNVTGIAGVVFEQYIIISEPDLIHGDNITVNVNVSYWNLTYVNQSARKVLFTPNMSLVGNHSVNISVNDSYGSADYQIINFEVQNNSIPYFNQSVGTRFAIEDNIWLLKVNATDADGDSLNFTDNTTLFDINISSGQINFTPNNTQVGNYTVLINVTDTKGAVNWTTFLLIVNNTNDAPNLSNLSTLPNIVVGYRWTYLVNATDEDIYHNTGSLVENLTFADNTTYFNITHHLYDQNSMKVTALINFTPNSTMIGNHTYMINVTDLANVTDGQLVVFRILSNSLAPYIINITPYGLPVSNTTFNWYNISYFPGNVTWINISENKSYLFNHTSISPENYSLSSTWYLNGSLFNTSHALNWTVGFFEQGMQNLTLVVRDERYSTANFTWVLNISNANRAPNFSGPYPNITMQEDAILTGSVYELTRYYSDPDNDTLQFNARQPAHVGIVITGDGDVTFNARDDWFGITWTMFNVSDGYAWVASNNVTINVTEVDDDDTGGTTGSTSGSGGGTVTITEVETVVEPYEIETPKPVNLDLLVPRPITMYENETILAPIVLRNRGNDTLKGISLFAYTNASDIKLEFTKYYFNQLLPFQQVETNLIITAYKKQGTYEVLVTAEVIDPDYNDSAIIFINSIEKNLENKTITNTKIAFARDLLRENAVCMELYELLRKADEALKNDELPRANLLIDSATEGCKYLIQNANAEREQPKPSYGGVVDFILNNKWFRYIALGVTIVVVILSLILWLQGRERGIRFKPYNV